MFKVPFNLRRALFGFVSVLFVGIVLYGCGKIVQTTNTPTSQTYSIINGNVKDANGAAISGVTITISTTAEIANDQGYFSISNISTTREVVMFSKSGKLTTYKIASLTAGQATFLDVVMLPGNDAQSFTATSGGTFTDESTTGLTGTVSLPASSLASTVGTHALATGAANITINPFDPTSSPEAFAGDYGGVNAAGSTVPFKSFGYLDVTITDASGNPLDLASGKSATVKVQVPASMTTEAASISPIPLWTFNATDGKWQQEGIATWDATAKVFVGVVTHFSPWNVDYPYTQALITGKVVDSAGNPISNAMVRARNVSRGWQNYDYSDSSGNFGPLPVEAGAAFTVYAQKGGLRSANYSESAIASGTTDIGNVVLDAPLIQITLTWGLDPRDLDSHLTVPGSTEGASRYHLLYHVAGDFSLISKWPNVSLDTDDTSSYGPEITSIYKLYNGVYRFCVHDYAGSSDITNSGAKVNLIISGGGTSAVYNFTPPSGLTTVKDVWEVFDLTVDANGNITSVNTLNGVLHNIGADDDASFSPNNAATTQTAGVRSQSIYKTK